MQELAGQIRWQPALRDDSEIVPSGNGALQQVKVRLPEGSSALSRASHAQQLFRLTTNFVEHQEGGHLLFLADPIDQARCSCGDCVSPRRQLTFAEIGQRALAAYQPRSAKLGENLFNFAQPNPKRVGDCKLPAPARCCGGCVACGVVMTQAE